MVAAWATAAPLYPVIAAIAGVALAAKLVWLFAASRWGAAAAARQAAEIRLLEDLAATAPGVWCRWSEGRDEERVAADFAARLGLAAGDGFDGFMARLADHHASRLAGALEGLRAGTDNDSFTLTVAAADGARSFAAAGASPSDHAGIVLWLTDVSDAAAANAANAAERNQPRAIIDTLPLPIWRRAADQALVYCNKAYADIVEADAAGATAGAGIELVAEAEAHKTRDLAKDAQSSGEAQTAAHHVIVDGARRLLKITESPLDGETVGIALDVTAIEEMSRNLDRHIEAHAAVIERLTTAIAIYGPDKQLEFFNSAYVRLYDFDTE